MISRGSEFGAVRSVFANRNYAIYTAGSSVALIGLWVQRLAVGWLIWELTGSGFWLGAVAFADLFPAVVVGPFAGVLADRLDRLKLAFVCQSLSFAQTVALVALTASGNIGITSLMALVLFLGVVRAVYQPVRLSLVPMLVRAEDVPSAVAISSIIFNLARFVGPALAGLIITVTGGVAPAFGFYAVAVLALLFALSRIRVDTRETREARKQSFLADVAEGIRYTARHEAIGPILLMMMAVSILARPAGELLPGFADAVFGRGAGGLAWLTSAVGLGAVAGGAWLARRGSAAGLVSIAIAGSGATALFLMLFSATAQFWIAVPALAGFGFSLVSAAIATQTLILGAVEESMRGRVISLYGVIFRGGPAIGALIMGALSGPLGLRAPVMAAGVLCLVAAAITWRRRRGLSAILERIAPKHGISRLPQSRL